MGNSNAWKRSLSNKNQSSSLAQKANCSLTVWFFSLAPPQSVSCLRSWTMETGMMAEWWATGKQLLWDLRARHWNTATWRGEEGGNGFQGPSKYLKWASEPWKSKERDHNAEVAGGTFSLRLSLQHGQLKPTDMQWLLVTLEDSMEKHTSGPLQTSVVIWVIWLHMSPQKRETVL